jgi:hypothetical protein
MAQVIEPPTEHSAQPGRQDAYLRRARRARVAVCGHLIDGRRFDTRSTRCDRVAVVVGIDCADHLTFPSAMAASTTEYSITRSCPAPRA